MEARITMESIAIAQWSEALIIIINPPSPYNVPYVHNSAKTGPISFLSQQPDASASMYKCNAKHGTLS